MAEGKPVASHVPSYECLTLKGSTSNPTIRAKSVSRSLWYRMVNRRWLLSTDLPSSCEQACATVTRLGCWYQRGPCSRTMLWSRPLIGQHDRRHQHRDVGTSHAVWKHAVHLQAANREATLVGFERVAILLPHLPDCHRQVVQNPVTRDCLATTRNCST